MSFSSVLSSVLQKARQLSSSKGDQDDLATLRQKVMDALIGCDGLMVARLRTRIENSSTASELWLFRSSVYDCVARQFSQKEASQRIQQLQPYFRGWLPASQLNRL